MSLTVEIAHTRVGVSRVLFVAWAGIEPATPGLGICSGEAAMPVVLGTTPYARWAFVSHRFVPILTGLCRLADQMQTNQSQSSAAHMSLSCCICGSFSAWELWRVGAKGEECEGDEGLRAVESEGDSCE